MKVLILGAGGNTGEAATIFTVKAGHEVTAFVYASEPTEFQCTYVRIVRGDARDLSLVRLAMSGQDAVLDMISTHLPFWNTHVETECARTVIQAMRECGVRRLIALSSIGESGSSSRLPCYYKYLILPTIRHGVITDKAEMEREVNSSQLEWTIIRPAPLIDGEPRGFRIIDEDARLKALPITRADVARFMVDQLSSHEYPNKSVTIAGVE